MTWLTTAQLRDTIMGPGQALGGQYTCHALRHRFATLAYGADRDLLAVQQLLGHAKPETIARYAALPPGALERAVLAAG